MLNRKKLKKTTCLLGLLFLASCSGQIGSQNPPVSPAVEGPAAPGPSGGKLTGEVSGGADTFSVSEAIFMSEDSKAKISTCYEVSAKFGVPAQDLESILRWAFGEWTAYIEAKDLTYAMGTGTMGIVGTLGNIVQGCKGGEDLRVYFGVENADVAQNRPRYLNPYAFSLMLASSTKTKMGAALLWFADEGSMNTAHTLPIWNKTSSIPYGALKVAVLHEIGHIFGNGHIDNTVMTSRIGQSLKSWTETGSDSSPQTLDLKIDQAIELVPNLHLPASFKLAGNFGFTLENGIEHYPDPQAMEKTFEKIFGIKPTGKVTAVAKRMQRPGHKPHERPDRVDEGTGVLELEFTDDHGPHSAKITTTAKVSQKDDSTPLFNGQYGNHYRSFGVSLMGSVEGGGAKPIPVLVNYNMGNTLTIVDLRGGGTKYPLLKVKPTWESE